MSTAQTWKWVSKELAIAAHQEQLVQHGGPAGIRDVTLLESALARAQQLAAYAEPDAAALAAAYAFGIARNHPFTDGNKRTAFVVMQIFLRINGWRTNADHVQCVLMMLQLAAGDVAEEDFADWTRRHLAPWQKK